MLNLARSTCCDVPFVVAAQLAAAHEVCSTGPTSQLTPHCNRLLQIVNVRAGRHGTTTLPAMARSPQLVPSHLVTLHSRSAIAVAAAADSQFSEDATCLATCTPLRCLGRRAMRARSPARTCCQHTCCHPTSSLLELFFDTVAPLPSNFAPPA